MILSKILQYLDRKRIKLHLMRTEYWMRNKDTTHLNPTQRKNRFQVLRLLHDYWKNEEFPINTTHKEKIPQIRDQKGTSCALAYILENSGEQKLVNNIAQQNNYVYVNDVPNDHQLFNAIKEGGFTKKEAAKIQPSYCQCTMQANTFPFFEPAAIFVAMVISIAGIAISLSIYRFSDKTILRSITMVAIVGVLVGGSVFVGLFQTSSANLFSEYPGKMEIYSVDDSRSIFYWISGGTVTEMSGGFTILLNVDASSKGEITMAFPGVSRACDRGTELFVHDRDFYVLINGEEVSTEFFIENKHYILKIPFEEGPQEIEIFSGGSCR